MLKNAIVCQSGGPTAVINSSLVGVIEQAKKSDYIEKIFGSRNGVEGMLNDNIIDLTELSKEDLNLLRLTPGAALGSARLCIKTDEQLEKALATFHKYNIGYVFIIGGNDSMDSCAKLSKYMAKINEDIHVIGVPKTVDNDLVNIDHTPGYGSSVKYIANTISEIAVDTSCYKKGRVTIIEAMGRDAGWLTASSKVACLSGFGPDLIYMPETIFDEEQFLNDVKVVYEKKQRALVVISEGIKTKDGEYLLQAYRNKGEANDAFGHYEMEGVAGILTELVSTKLNIKTRDMVLNLPQRCSSHFLSKTDLKEAEQCGRHAVIYSKNHTGKMVTMKRNGNDSYHIKYGIVSVSKIANAVKQFPAEWIINGNDISKEYIDYVLPLIQGEVKNIYEDGLIKYYSFK